MKYALIFLLLPLFVSCDRYVVTSGTVVDQASGQPLADARVTNSAVAYGSEMTNEKGYFSLRKIESPGLFVKPFKVLVEKPGYQSVEWQCEHFYGNIIPLKRTP